MACGVVAPVGSILGVRSTWGGKVRSVVGMEGSRDGGTQIGDDERDDGIIGCPFKTRNQKSGRICIQ